VTEAHELGPLEIRVLEQLTAEEPRSVSDVQRLLGESGPELAYTTVMTVLGRLHDKRVVTRRREGKRYLYALSGQSQRASSMLTRLHRRLFGVARLAPVAALLDEADVSTEDLRELRRLIDRKLKERRG
jgi:predicted transcriptional regulator